jgi:hypothetical protein
VAQTDGRKLAFPGTNQPYIGRFSESKECMSPQRPRNEGLEPWLARMGDRFCEPLHLNLISALVGVLGNHRAKVAFDLVRRRHYAYSVLRAADLALTARGVSGHR